MGVPRSGTLGALGGLVGAGVTGAGAEVGAGGVDGARDGALGTEAVGFIGAMGVLVLSLWGTVGGRVSNGGNCGPGIEGHQVGGACCP